MPMRSTGTNNASAGRLVKGFPNAVWARTPVVHNIMTGQARMRKWTSARSSPAERTMHDVSRLELRAAATPALVAASAPVTTATLAYEVIQGALAKWTVHAPGQAPPTAVLVHGILGSKRNLNRFARLITETFPSWQVLLVDLRCHGDSAGLPRLAPGPDGVASAAADVIRLLRELRLFPTMLIGHSFGGKCVMSMVQQFGGSGSLPRPVQVWALDALPGQVRSGTEDGRDHPAALLQTLLAMSTPITSKKVVVDTLLSRGFSPEIANWAATNLRPLSALPSQHDWALRQPAAGSVQGPMGWSVDLEGIAEMYRSYQDTSLWQLLESPPQGLELDFVRAEGSNFRWGDDEHRIRSLGHGVHLLRNSGHWVHTDNPKGLLDILSPSFGAQPMLKARGGSPALN